MHITVREFDISTTYDVGDRFIYNGETYEVDKSSVGYNLSPEHESGCHKIPINPTADPATDALNSIIKRITTKRIADEAEHLKDPFKRLFNSTYGMSVYTDTDAIADSKDSLKERLDTVYNSFIKATELPADLLAKADKGVRFEDEIKCEDTKPVVHGHWIGRGKTFVPLDKDDNTTDSCWCSICGDWLTGSDEYSCRGKYCPNCGAKMDEKEEEKLELI